MCDFVDISILGKKMFFQTAIVGEKLRNLFLNSQKIARYILKSSVTDCS